MRRLPSLEKDKAFNVALLDYQMPGSMDGVGLAFKMQRETPEIPVIVLSNSFDVTNIKRPKNLKVWLYKPIKPERLKSSIVQLLNQSEPRPELEEKIDPDLFDPLRKIKILLAEDNVVNQKVFTRVLQRLGYLPDIASDGSEAVTSVKRQPYDLVFMDVQMPHMDGLQATAEIRKLGTEIVQPHIVALTAELNTAVVAECESQGMNAALQKPAKAEEIIMELYAAKREFA